MTTTSTIPPVLGLTDLAKRWGRSGEYVRLHMRDTDAFPEPAGAINGGRNRFWLVSNLETYEAQNPHVYSEENRPDWLDNAQEKEPDRSRSGADLGVETATDMGPKDGLETAQPVGTEARNEPEPVADSGPEQLSLDVDWNAEPDPVVPSVAKKEPKIIAYLLAFRFPTKPPFQLREDFKKDGWVYYPQTDEWTAKVLPRDVDDYRWAFSKAGAIKIIDEPVYESWPV